MKESYFLDFWVVSSVVPIFKKLGETSTAKNYRPVSFLYLVSDMYQKLILFFLSKRCLKVVSKVKSSQDYSANAGVSEEPHLALCFSRYTLMTFLMNLYSILLSMLMILLSTLSVIRYLICSPYYSLLLAFKFQC